jgi:hypothetical protein
LLHEWSRSTVLIGLASAALSRRNEFVTAAQRAGAKVTVRVVLDTTAIYSEKPGHILSGPSRNAFAKSGAYNRLEIEWYVPEMAVREREVQLAQQCADWRDDSGEKLNKTLDLKLNLSNDEIRRRIRDRIAHELVQSGVTLLRLATDGVNWESLVRDAGERNLPFSTGEEEKGFRDRVIGETFLQVIGDAAAGRRCVLVTNDEDLSKWVTTKIAGRGEVHVVRDFAQLDAFLKALAKQEDESLAIKLQANAAELFYRQGETGTLYYEWKVEEQLRTKYPPELIITPSGANRRDEKFTVAPPEFLKHESGRFQWLSRVTVEIWFWDWGWFDMTTRQIFRAPVGFQGLLSSGISTSSTSSLVTPSTSSVSGPPTVPTTTHFSPGLGIGERSASYQRLVRKATCEFPVNWSTSERDGVLIEPQLGPIEVGQVTLEP